MDIVKLLNEAADDILDWGAYAGEYFQNKHDLEGCAQQYRDAAAELEAREPDYWVSVDGVYVDFGMRRPMAEDDGANWCARTEVNQHINDSMGDQPGLRLHLEPLYRHPPTERAVPEGWQLVPVEPTEGMVNAGYGWREYDTPDHWPPTARGPYGTYRAMLEAAPGAGGDV